MKNTILNFIKSILILLDPRKQVIGVDKETYSNLMELSKEMNTQDHRSTCMPYFFQVQHLKEVSCYEGQGVEVWVDENGEGDMRTNEEFEEFISESIDADFEEYFKDVNFQDDADLEDDEFREAYISDYIKQMTGWQKETFLEENGYRKYNVEDKEVYSKCFFTAKACNEYIQSNKHHYREPVSFLSGNYRSHEIELVQRFLCELSGGKLHK
jgi:hypothetical protein